MLITQNLNHKRQNKTVRYDLCYFLCAHKKITYFDFVFMCINYLKNQRLEIIYISMILQALDDNQNKVEMSYFFYTCIDKIM